MAGVAPMSGAPSAVQSGMQQLRLQQAQRNAQQAEQQARALQAQAANARQVADRAEENARALEVRSDQASENAGRARLGLTAMKTVGQMQTRLGEAYGRIAQEPDAAPKATPVESAARPTVNAQGQTTGRIVNTSA